GGGVAGPRRAARRRVARGGRRRSRARRGGGAPRATSAGPCARPQFDRGDASLTRRAWAEDAGARGAPPPRRPAPQSSDSTSRQPENAMRDDVALDLARTAGDGHGAVAEVLAGPAAAPRGGPGAPERRRSAAGLPSRPPET